MRALFRWVRRFFRDDRHREALSFFRNVSIFHGLSARQLGRLMQSMQRRDYRAGEILFEEGHTGRAVFIIRSGRVELSRRSTDGPQGLGVLGAGQIFGEMALLEKRPRTATATVVEDGAIYLLYTATLESLFRRHPETGLKLMRNIAVMLSALLRRSNERPGLGAGGA